MLAWSSLVLLPACALSKPPLVPPPLVQTIAVDCPAPLVRPPELTEPPAPGHFLSGVEKVLLD